MDLTPLLDSAGPNEALLNELKELARKQLRELPTQLETASRRDDLLGVSRVAHKARAVAQTLRLADLDDTLIRLELVGKGIVLEGAPKQLTDNERERYQGLRGSLAPELTKWLTENLSLRTLSDLINLCKLQSQNALSDPAWRGSTAQQ